MAETVHLFLKANGVDIKGDSSLTSAERSDSIECLAYDWAASVPHEQGAAVKTGHRQMQPIVIRKRIDRASPLLAKALFENQKIEATFKFYRHNPSDGMEENYYNVTIEEARLASLRQISPWCLNTNQSGDMNGDEPATEEVGFVFHTIEVTHPNGGISHRDTWSEPR